MRMSPDWYAGRTPDAAAIIMGCSGEIVTYRQLDDRSRRIAAALREQGLQAGDHVALLMGNERAFLEVAWAAQRAGLYYTAINNHLRSREVQYVLDDCQASALVAGAGMAPVVSGLDLSRVRVRVSVDDGLSGFVCYDDVLASAPAGPLEGECEGREMLYSSGTTGFPKGVRKPLSGTEFGDPSAVPSQIAVAMTEGGGPGTVYLCPAPLYHSAPLVGSMSWHRVGGTVVLMEKFDPHACLDLIERYRITDAQFVPTMFVRLLRLPDAVRERYDVSSLRRVLHTGAPCPVAVKQQMLAWWGPVIDEYYSGTEDLGATYISAAEWLDHPGSVGRPLDECHIVGEDGQTLGPREIGVVYFAGRRPFEYHNDEHKTRSVANDRGWRTLGDMGFLDEEGYLYLTDRQAHMIISGGVNIYPQEAENVLAGHPAVADVAVIGVPDEEMGEAVKALVQLSDGTRPTADVETALIDFCRAALATYKCPRTVDFVESLPRDPNGKLYKRLLRDSYWEGHESRVI